jgi:hypothetical protein
MPDPVKIKTNSKLYIVPILNGEMDNIAQQIEQDKEEIRRTRERLTNTTNNLNTNSQALLLMYIQQMGEFPPS